MLTPISRQGSHFESLQTSQKALPSIRHGIASSSTLNARSSSMDPCGLVTHFTNWLKRLILSVFRIELGAEKGVKITHENLIQKGNEIYDQYREPKGVSFPSRVCTFIRYNGKIISMPLATLAEASSIPAFRNNIKARMSEALANVSLTSGGKLSISTHFFHDRGRAEKLRYYVHYHDCSIDMRTGKQRSCREAGDVEALSAQLELLAGGDRDRLDQLTTFLF